MFPARSQVPSAERGWLLDHQTLKPSWGGQPERAFSSPWNCRRRSSKKCERTSKKSTKSPHKTVILGLLPRGTNTRLVSKSPRKPFPSPYSHLRGTQTWTQLVRGEKVEEEKRRCLPDILPTCNIPSLRKEKLFFAPERKREQGYVHVHMSEQVRE